MTGFRFASLGSGSRGNAMVIEAGQTRLLLDNGFTVRETLRRLEAAGIEAGQLDAVLVTHEHSDHSAGVVPLARRFGLPVFLTAGTHRGMESRDLFVGKAVDCRRVVRGKSFAIGTLRVNPVRVPHDAQEPCQYVFEAGGFRLGVLTDLGCVTPAVVAAYDACDALFLESNHDARMLAQGPYPPSLKSRVAGEFGHLSNAQAAQFLRELDRSRLGALVIGHLSEQNNLPELARATIARALERREAEIVIASQSTGHDWVAVTSFTARPAGHTGA